MSKQNEQLADIVAEMRTKAECAKPYDDGIVMMLTVLADRIEAAAKREREAAEADALTVGGVVEAGRHKPGNAAAMRETLEVALRTIRGIIDGTLARRNQSVFDCRDQLKAALSAPPRNCDVGTPEEQRARFDKFCRSNSWDEIDGAHCMSSCPLYHGDCSRCEELEWAQMPYKKGATK